MPKKNFYSFNFFFFSKYKEIKKKYFYTIVLSIILIKVISILVEKQSSCFSLQ